MVPSTAIVQSEPVSATAAKAETLDLAPATARQHAAQALFAAVDDQSALARNRAYQMMELRLDRRQVGKDVGVIVFEIVEDRRARAVMHELGTLVAERGVVLVGLDDEECTVGQVAPIRQSRPPRRRSGIRAANRRVRESRQATPWPWSCRACRRQPAPTCPATQSRPATAARRYTDGPHRGSLRAADCRVKWRCRSRTRRRASRRRRVAPHRNLRSRRSRASATACSSVDTRWHRSRSRCGPPGARSLRYRP